MKKQQLTRTTRRAAAAAMLWAALGGGSLALLSACTEADGPQGAPHLEPLTLSIAGADYADGTTRAATGTTSFATGSVASVRFAGQNVVDADGTQKNEAWWKINTGFVTAADDATATTLYWAPGATDVLADAYLPNSYNPDGQTAWSVSQDQTGAAGYQASDLMYGQGRVVRGDAASRTIGLEHMMAKVIVTTTGQEPTAVRIVAGYRTIAIDNAAIGRLSALNTVSNHGGLSDELSPSAALTFYSAAAGSACLLPPQEIGAGQAFLEVEGPAGTVRRYRFSAPQTLKGGNYYRLDLNLADAAPGATVTLSGWSATGGTSTQPATQLSPGVYQVGTQTFRMVPVKGGTMNNLWEKSGYNVTLSDYYIGETEVTQGLWKAVMDGLKHANGTALGTQSTVDDNCPVAFVSWDDIMGSTTIASGFIDRLNEFTATQRPAGYYFTLPTGAQWEYAARGGIHSRGYAYPGGNDALEIGWYGSEGTTSGNSDGYVHEVAQKRANELGLYDMGGNVQEWCVDYLLESSENIGNCASFPANGTYTDPWLSTTAVSRTGGRDNRLLRGGNFTNAYGNSRSRYSGVLWGYENRAERMIGLRLCLRKIQPGDVYFSDGSVGAYPAEHPGKTPIGIVISTEPSAADQALGYTHGYVMALGEANGGAALTSGWATGTARTTQMTDVTYNSDVEATQWDNITGDMDGLTHCRTALANAASTASTGTIADLAAINAARSYTPAAPGASSGWYLPSIGQFYQLVKAFAPTYAVKANWTYRTATATRATSDFEMRNQARRNAIVSAINAALAKAGTGYTAVPDTGEHPYWSSTERTAGNVFDLYIDHEQYTLNGPCTKDNAKRYVRPVLAF